MLERLVRCAALAAGIATLPLGCYSNSVKDVPRASQQRIALDSSWKSYVSGLAIFCKTPVSRLGQEKEIHRYLCLLNELAGKKFNEESFEIIPNGRLAGFFSCGIAGLVAPDGGIYWDGKIFIREKGMSLSSIAHEVGHASDPYLDSWQYVTDERQRIRMEAVAEAFEYHAGLELIRMGNISEGELFLLKPDAPLPKKGDIYEKAQEIALSIRSDSQSTTEAWLYLATHETEDIFARVERIGSEKGVKNAIEEGIRKINEENAIVRAQYHHLYTKSLMLLGFPFLFERD